MIWQINFFSCLVDYYQSQPLLKKEIINCIKVFYEGTAKT